ncbi:probable aspartic proteinase GIP2 [Rutidosis leptorrhynchoides]|uniref:probable aspartic proteinase GIP2 n=1 Tax=Rutidosis leptorrhynchoides TaxID=125765 RepID=UPI003A99F3E4
MSSLIFILFFLAQITNNPNGFLLKLDKDLQTHQYTTQLLIGTHQPLPTKLVVHLSGDSLWLRCSTSSSSHQFISHNSIQCLIANKSQKPTKYPKICNVQQRNPITGVSSIGDLAEDHVEIGSGLNRVLFSCLSSDYLLKGLVSDAKGVLGLGKSKIALQSQIVNNFDFPRKFTVCLSPVTGFISSGNTKHSLSYTPLIINSIHNINAYYINVNSININGRKLSSQQPIGSVEISSVVPYTTIQTTIYDNFVQGYVTAAKSMNMTMVGPTAPFFRVCYQYKEVVPEIELVLQSEFVKWKMHSKNSMVRVSDSVMCLAFVDGGFDMNSMMVLGGYQLEDRILEFNLGTNMMGFGSSLLMDGTSCANVMESVSTRKESLQ